MKNFTGVETLIPLPGNWSNTLNEWFCGLLLDEPKAQPPVSEQEWQSWLKFVEWHGMSSLIFTLLRSMEIHSQPPVEIYAALRQAYFANAARIMVRRSQLEILVKQLRIEKIEPVVLKGAAFGEMIYSDILQRPSADIDILVSKKEYEKARKIILQNGYDSKRGERTREMDWICQEDFIPIGNDKDRKHVVELHWGLSSHVQILNKIDTPLLIRQAVKVEGLNHSMLVLHPVHALIHTCAHLLYTHINELRLIWLYDIHLLAQSIERLGTWSETIEQSQQWQGRLALKYCLELANKWFETPFPEQIRDLNHKPASRQEMELFNLAIYQFKHGQREGWLRRHLFQLSHLKGRDKFNYLRNRLFPSRREIEAGYPRLRFWPGPLIYLGRLAMMFVTKK
jgi:hypothetical protein